MLTHFGEQVNGVCDSRAVHLCRSQQALVHKFFSIRQICWVLLESFAKCFLHFGNFLQTMWECESVAHCAIYHLPQTTLPSTFKTTLHQGEQPFEQRLHRASYRTHHCLERHTIQ